MMAVKEEAGKRDATVREEGHAVQMDEARMEGMRKWKATGRGINGLACCLLLRDAVCGGRARHTASA